MVVTVHGYSHRPQGENQEESCVVRCHSMAGGDLATFQVPMDRKVERLTLELAQLLNLPMQRVKLVSRDGRLLQPEDTVRALL